MLGLLIPIAEVVALVGDGQKQLYGLRRGLVRDSPFILGILPGHSLKFFNSRWTKFLTFLLPKTGTLKGILLTVLSRKHK